jgi:4-hydroxy-tetrahydrodipicolinate synthase
LDGRRPQLLGILVPILTPLLPDERVDIGSLRRLVGYLLDAGVHGIWALGTTGEFAALDAGQRAVAAQAVVEEVGGRVPVVVNVGDSGTGLALRHAAAAVDAGADYLALTPPHYYPHSQDEVRAHFERVKDRFADVPLLAYNIPQTVKVKLGLDTTLALVASGTISGIKDSQNDLQWFRQLSLAVTADGRGDQFRMLLGTRSLIDVAVQVGAHGAVPAVGNVAPADCVAAYQRSIAGDGAAALAAQARALRYEGLGDVANGGSENARLLAAMKVALRHRGVLDTADVTAPLRPLTAGEASQVIDEYERLARTVARA